MQEIFKTSSYYGHNRILRDFAGYPRAMPFPVGLQHGWTFLASSADFGRKHCRLWAWSQRMRNAYAEEFSHLAVEAVGAPFLYLLRGIGFQPLRQEHRIGSVVFPAHSSHYIEAKVEYGRYIAMLSDLPEWFKPISICMYYTDAAKGNDEIFRKAGFKVVSNGNSRLDADFLYRLVDNVKEARYVLSNELTSALLYANAMDIPAYLFGPESESINIGNKHLPKGVYKVRNDAKTQAKKVFRFPDADISVQKRYSAGELGQECMLNKKAMTLKLVKYTLSRRYFAHMGVRLLMYLMTLNRT